MSAVAVILARSGSKGVPGKNSADVAGRPCLAWSIEHAQRSALVSRVVVTTDDGRCAEIAREMGAELVSRPDDLANDGARVDDAVRHAHGAVGSPEAPVVALYANVPVRPGDLTDRAVAMLGETGCDSVQSFARVGKHHPWWTAKLGEGGAILPWEGDQLFHGCFRRQDLPEAIVPDGGVMAVSLDALFGRVGAPEGPHGFLGVDRRAVVTDEGDVVDIDAPIDLIVADAVLRERCGARVAHADR